MHAITPTYLGLKYQSINGNIHIFIRFAMIKNRALGCQNNGNEISDK